MINYEISMKHTEKTLESLSRMQYNLFCKGNKISRSIVSLISILFGIIHFSDWWGILLTAYGCYLTTSTYSSANHTAHKLTEQIKKSGMPFPASRYLFENQEMKIFSLPSNHLESTLAYSDMLRLGEDYEYFYIFQNQVGGYMIPKSSFSDPDKFRQFLETKTGKTFSSKTAPILRLIRYFQSLKK